MMWCRGYFLVDDANPEYKDTMQELMLELKLKTVKMLKKLKEQSNTNKVGHDY